jgi:peptide/nickel transport system substrate-binding protein
MNRRQLLSASAAALLSPRVSLAQGAARAGAALTVGLRTGPESIDPHWSTLGGHVEALRHIYDSLIGQPAPSPSYRT